MNERNNLTLAWEYYEKGRAYNNSLVPNQYRLVNTNIEFFAGNQWLHMPETPAMSRLPKPTFNIIKRVASLFVASLTSSAVTVSFDPLSYYDGENLSDPETNAAEYATAEVQNLFEKFKMEYRVREALFDGAQTGDYCAHFYWDADALPYGGAFGPYRGEIQMELVDGINVMFGNPNTPIVEKQPYILIVGRESVDKLKAEANRFSKRRGKESTDGPGFNDITPDNDYENMPGLGGQTELIASDDASGKALYCYLYTKKTTEEKVIDPHTGEPIREPIIDKNGDPVPEKDGDGNPIINMDGTPVYKTRVMKQPVTTVHVTKATKNCVIYEDVDTGLTRYPIAWGNWERQKNQYHGRALVTGIIPNQIFINSMFAMVMRHLQLMSFPKTVYNADLISQWDNEIGRAIGVRNLMPNQRIDQVAYNLQPADMSNQIMMAIDKAVAYTKDCLGATDAQLGNVKPDNTSALMVLQSSAEVPLENTRACLYEWVEDIGAILLDMMGTYYGERPLVRERSFDEPVVDQATGMPLIDPMTGTMQTRVVTHKVTEDFDFSQFKHLWLNTRADVGATTYYSEIAMVQTLDNLRQNGTLEVIDYLERIPDKLIPRKRELIEDIQARMAEANPVSPTAIPGLGGAGDKAAPSLGGPLSPDKAIGSLPASVQSKYSQLPGQAQRALVQQTSLSNR